MEKDIMIDLNRIKSRVNWLGTIFQTYYVKHRCTSIIQYIKENLCLITIYMQW